MRLLPAIIIAVALLLAPLVWHFSRSLFVQAPTVSSSEGFSGGVIDDTARIEILNLQNAIAEIHEAIKRLETATNQQQTEFRPLDSADAASDDPSGQLEGSVIDSDVNAIADDYAEVVSVEDRRRINRGLSVPPRAFLSEVFGRPRESLSDKCQSPTNPKFASMLVLEDFGNFRVQLMRPAVESLKRVFENIQAIDPELYERINTAGALCIRRIRGSTAISSHAFGLAIDLNIDGQLDRLGDGRTQLGLTIIADIFQNEGWLWGAAFGREDSMHFEVSKELIDQWVAQGRI